MWIPNVEALSGHYRTYAVDNIYDVGRSVYTRTMQSSNDLVAWFDELFSALALGDNINLVGLSYGGLAPLATMLFPLARKLRRKKKRQS